MPIYDPSELRNLPVIYDAPQNVYGLSRIHALAVQFCNAALELPQDFRGQKLRLLCKNINFLCVIYPCLYDVNDLEETNTAIPVYIAARIERLGQCYDKQKNHVQ